jgi:hypothetical protein
VYGRCRPADATLAHDRDPAILQSLAAPGKLSKQYAARVLDITDGVGVDHIVEVDFGGNLTATLRCVRINGSIAVYATNADREPRVPVRELMQRNLAVYSMSLAGVPHVDRRRAQSDTPPQARTSGRCRRRPRAPGRAQPGLNAAAPPLCRIVDGVAAKRIIWSP